MPHGVAMLPPSHGRNEATRIPLSTMSLSPQPPPDVPAPPASEAAELSRLKWKWLMVVGVTSVIGCFFWLTRPVVIRSHRNSDMTDAVINARQIGLALFEFDTEYGKFPDETTIESVKQKTGTKLYLGKKSANDFLRQLLADGGLRNEQMFFAKIPGARKPDGAITGDRALEKGEVGFSYISGLSTAGNPSRPVLVTPVIPGTNRFDRTVFDGRALIMKMDNSVISLPINADGHVMVGGKHLLDPTNSVWGAKDKWKLVWPE